MKKNICLNVLLIFISGAIYSQKDSVRIARNIIYLEAAGAGGYGSLNYERVVFCRNRWMIGARLGLSTYHISDYSGAFNPDIIIPLMVTGYYGRNNKIEAGAGETFANIVHANLTEIEPKRNTDFHTNFHIGYRYQKNKGGIFIRCAYTPMLEFNRHFRHWGGLSLGYSF